MLWFLAESSMQRPTTSAQEWPSSARVLDGGDTVDLRELLDKLLVGNAVLEAGADRTAEGTAVGIAAPASHGPDEDFHRFSFVEVYGHVEPAAPGLAEIGPAESSRGRSIESEGISPGHPGWKPAALPADAGAASLRERTTSSLLPVPVNRDTLEFQGPGHQRASEQSSLVAEEGMLTVLLIEAWTCFWNAACISM